MLHSSEPRPRPRPYQPKSPVATVASSVLARIAHAINPEAYAQPAATARPPPRIVDAAQASLVHLKTALGELLARYDVPVPSLLQSGPAIPSPPVASAATDPASLTILATTLIAGLLIVLFALRRMSWSSRFGSWGGRFSPFGRGDTSSTAVSDADFSYITSEDLAASQKNLGAAPSGSTSPPSTTNTNSTGHTSSDSTTATSGRSNADGQTDILVLKHKRVSYPVHFPRGAIDAGELGVRNIRDAAARKMEVDDPRRIKLFYKGRQLKDDQAARAVGLRSDMESDVLCVVGEGPPFGSHFKSDAAHHSQRDTASGSSDSDSDDGNDSSSMPGGSGRGSKSKKKRNRRGGKKHKKSGRSSETPEPSRNNSHGVYVGGGAGSEFLGVPAGAAVPPRPASSSSNRPPPSPVPPVAGQSKLPQTPMEKLDALSSKFHTTFVPLCVQFINRPPSDAAKRDFEHKKLTETILAQVLLKLDAVDTSGDETARARRKELVRECNGMLGRLDELMSNY